MHNITILGGNIFTSKMQALVNPINCQGVMGKGLAKSFKDRYPEMYHDYVIKCHEGGVLIGYPYPYQIDNKIIINFPTKNHWRDNSRKEYIILGMLHLVNHLNQWNIESIAVPALGCGEGGLSWQSVYPILQRYLVRTDIPAEIYIPGSERWEGISVRIY